MLGHVLLIRFKLDADHRAIAAVQAAFLASLVNFLLGQGAVDQQSGQIADVGQVPDHQNRPRTLGDQQHAQPGGRRQPGPDE